MRFSYENYTTPLLLFLAVSSGAIWLKEPTFATLSVAVTLWLEAELIGRLVFPERARGARLPAGLFLLLCWLTIIGSAIYLFFDLGVIQVAAIWLISGLAILGIGFRQTSSKKTEQVTGFWKAEVTSVWPLLIALFTVACDLLAVDFLRRGVSDAALRSPWHVVHPLFFVCIALSTLGVCTLAALGMRRLALIVGILHTAICATVAMMVYQLGFGFDSFIHQRTEHDIFLSGAVYPKTPYYIGQYVLVVMAAHLTHIPTVLWDRLLVPLGYGLIMPVVAVWTTRHFFHKRTSTIALVGALLFPFGAFVVTTPQGWSYLLALLTLAASIVLLPDRRAVFFMIGGTLATITVHPLTGIPLAGIMCLLYATQHKKTTRPILQSMGVALVLGGVPLAFIINGWLGSTLSVSFDVNGLVQIAKEVFSWRPALRTGSAWLDTVVWWHVLAPVLIAVAAGYAYARAPQTRQQQIQPLFVGAALLVGGFGILSCFRFSLGGDTGGAAFPFRFRMLELALLVLFIPAVMALPSLWQRVSRSPLTRVMALFAICLVATANVYAAYPRVDRTEPTKSFAVSASTMHAVTYIHDSATEPYIVLGNQTAAAAAIERFGFEAYYAGNFYYSHESSAPDLDAFFYAMNRLPGLDVVYRAMDFAGVDQVFYVVHDYWNGSERIVAEAQKIAGQSTAIDDGKIWIFRFDR